MQFSSAPRRRVLAAISAPIIALGAAVALAPVANAAFVVPRCGGEAIAGIGASFADNAQKAFSQNFRSTAAGCPGHPLISYSPLGSGRGRGGVGGATAVSSTSPDVPGVRANTVRFGGTDEGPTTDQQNNMNRGPDPVGTADDGKVRVVPIAAGAVVPTVNYPSNGTGGVACPIPAAFKLTRAGRDRLAVPNVRLERAWGGEFATWGAFLPGLSEIDAGCAAKPLVRVVRQDSSGTTFAWKDYLDKAAALNTGSGRDWVPALSSSSALNRTWPNTRAGSSVGGSTVSEPVPAAPLGFQTPTPDTECRAAGEAAGTSQYISGSGNFIGTGSPVCRSGANGNELSNGNGPQARLLKRTDGSIGYTELATVVAEDLRLSATNSDVYGMALAVRDAGVPGGEFGTPAAYVEATATADGFVGGASTGGANCSNVPVNGVPQVADPTAAIGWNAVSMVMPTAGYSACSLTYMLAFDDNAPVYLSIAGNEYNAEERKARALKDYLSYIVSDTGQATLIGNDYAPLPFSALGPARDGVNRIDWDKTGTLRPPPRTTPPPPPPPPPPLPPGPPPVVPPPVISNMFTIASARSKGIDLLLSVRVPGAGSIAATASGTYKQRRRTRKVSVGRTTATVSRAGSVNLKIRLSTAARSALRRSKRLVVKIDVTYLPRGGTAARKTRTLVLKVKKKRTTRS